MRKVKILIITKAEETSLFEILAEALGSKNFDLANNIVVIRNKILQLPVIELPDDFKLMVADKDGKVPEQLQVLAHQEIPPAGDHELGGVSLEVNVPVEQSHQEKMDKIARDNKTKNDILQRTEELTRENNAKGNYGVPKQGNFEHGVKKFLEDPTQKRKGKDK